MTRSTYIKTLPRRGYIFEADVVKNGAGTENAQISSEIINGEEPLPLEAADAPSVVTGKSEALYGSKICAVGRTNAAYGGGHIRYSCLISIGKHVTACMARGSVDHHPGVEDNPALSPDNSRVAFTWNGEKQDNFDIYVQPIGPGRPQRLTTDPAQDTSPAWSPQGDKIAFLRRINGDRNHLVLIPAFGGPEQIVAETRSRVLFGTFGSDLRKNLAWTPDGHWIVAQASRNRRIVGWFVLVFSLDGRKKADDPIAHGLFRRKPRILSLRRCYCLCPSCRQGTQASCTS